MPANHGIIVGMLDTILIGSPYTQPKLKRGDRAFCLYKDCDVIITTWTDAPISWPRCRGVENPMGHPGLLVDAELERAIRTESAKAIKRAWGVSTTVLWKWRRAFGIEHFGTPGNKILHERVSARGADKTRDEPLPLEAVELRRRNAIRLNLGRFLRENTYIGGRPWTDAELIMLGTDHDEVVAAKIDRTPLAVTVKRMRMRIPILRDRRQKQ